MKRAETPRASGEDRSGYSEVEQELRVNPQDVEWLLSELQESIEERLRSK